MTSAATAAVAAAPRADAAPRNPLIETWRGRFGGLPPFSKANPETIKAGITEGMARARAEIAAIAGQRAAPTFANTIVKMEDSGRALDRAYTFYNVHTNTLSDAAMQAVETELEPKLAAFNDEITQNAALFARVKAVYESRDAAGLDEEQKRLSWLVYNRFARRGAALGAEDKTRLSAINQRLAALFTTFSQNLLAAEGKILWLDAEADLDGMPASFKESAAEFAKAKGKPGKWGLANSRSSMEPFLTFATRRDLREKAFRLWTSRGEEAGPNDNRPVMSEILALRGERAKLLGFATHAHWITADAMAKTPERATDLMLRVWRPAVARVREEVADMQAIANADRIVIAPWDYRFYSEKVRKAKYDLDEAEVKPYLQLDKMREAMFWSAERLFGFAFRKLEGIDVAHPDVTVYEVRRGDQHVGLWYFDPFARDGKRSGAWMNAYRSQENMRRAITPIVSNNSNFVKAKPGAPVLISWDDASTLFHEFGHALHGLSSKVRYPTLSGTNVARDFVEFPSQINERWLATPEVLSRFAIHAETGAPMPEALLAKIQRAQTFNQGFATIEYLASAIYDMRIHLETSHPIDPAAFERSVLAEIGMPSEIVMRHRPTQFGHIFSGDGYSAGYYSYIWSDTLTADAWEAFTEASGPWDAGVARRYSDVILSSGAKMDPAEAFRAFRGRDVEVGALMRARGFPAT